MAGTARRRSCITAAPTTEIARGTAATMVRAPLHMERTAPRTPATGITRAPGLTHVARQSRTVTEAKASAKRTTQEQEHTAQRSRVPMPMEAGEARRSRRTAPLPTCSTRRRLREPPRRCKPRTGPRLMGRRGSMATAPQWDKPPMATSTPRQTATPTRTRAVAGKTRTEVQTNMADRVPIPMLPRAGEGRKRVAGRQPSEAEAEAGNPGRRVLVARQAEAVVAAGADEVQRCGPANGLKSGERLK